MNLVEKLVEQKQCHPKRLALQYFKNSHLYDLNWTQVYDHVSQIYTALASLPIKKGDFIGLYGNTCKEWGFIDLATMATGAVSVPIDHSSHKDDIQVILQETQPKVLFIQSVRLYNNLLGLDELKSVKKIIIIDEFDGKLADVITLKQFIDSWQKQPPLEVAAQQIQTHDLATIVYTSGTSGRPKGVCLHHQQIMSSVSDVFPLLGVSHMDKTLTFLPLSHILGRIELWGHYFLGYSLGYAESIDRIKQNLVVIRPTVLVAVPIIFEKIFFGIKAQVEISKLKQGLFNRALNIKQKINQLRQEKRSPDWLLAIQAQLAYRIVFSNIKDKLGGRLRFAISGGAPLSPLIADVFSNFDIPILEGYGLTETTGPVFVNTLFNHQTGCVGRAIGDVQAKIASDGEILIKSQKVMPAYFKNDSATQQVFTEDGFFKTGDIGKIDDQGFLKITDRKKDLIKTSGGKFVAPQKLENLFTTHPLISHIHIHGDKRKYVVALVTLDKQRLFQLKNDYNISSQDFAQLSRHRRIQLEVRKSIAEVNSELAPFETIKRFDILDHEFTVQGGQLTTSLKMKRKHIDQLYKKEIDDMYS